MAIDKYLERVFGGTAAEFLTAASEAMLSGEKQFIVTANPEILMHAEKDAGTRQMLLDKTVRITPDGVSVVKAMQMCGLPVKERIAGVDLAEGLLKTAGENQKTVYLLGAKEEVVSTLAKNLTEQYPGMTVHYHNGYDGDKDAIMKEIAGIAPDLTLVALGVPAQEKLIYRHLPAFTKGVLIGVGGSFDVLSGLKKRAPVFFIKTNTEWVYRIAKEPWRLKRFYNSNIKFMGEVRRTSRKR